MILVIKWTSFAWSVFDGTLKSTSLSQDQQKRVVKLYPTPVAFAGYTFFFGGFLVGPAFEYREYQMFIDGEVNHRPSLLTTKPPFDKIPNACVPALECIALATAFLLIYVKFNADYSFITTTTPDFYNNYSVLQKFMFFNACGFMIRVKFYVVWKLSEGACILSGLGYSGVNTLTGKHVWTRVQNINILDVEFPQNPRMMMAGWNVNTQRVLPSHPNLQKWLKNHVYLRLINPQHTNATLVTTITFMTSALWHGFHAGYYLSFLFVSLYIVTGRIARRHFRPLFLTGTLQPNKKVYDFAGYVVSWGITNYLVAPFQLLDGVASLKSWKSMWFYWHVVMMAVVGGVGYLGGGRVLKRVGKMLGCVDEKAKTGRVAENVKIE